MSKRWEDLGELEGAVMEIVWSGAPVTVRDVCDRLHGRRERAYTTIMTTLDRLHRKGLLTRRKDGLAWRYEPSVSKADFERALADRLAATILTAHGENALAAFVDAAARVDASLLERLRHLLDQYGRRRS